MTFNPNDPRPPFESVQWDLRREGYAWDNDIHGEGHCMRRYYMAPHKNELIDGRIYWREEDRLFMLALLLENVGVDQAVRIGDPAVWKAAVAQLPD